jgi:hypothetical protein
MAKLTTYNGIAGLNRALRALPREASAKLREASQEITEEVAADARSRATSIGRSYKLVAPTIKAAKDRYPVIKMGGSRRLPGRSGPNQTVGNLLWGSEFGGRKRPTTQQFLPHRGQMGYAVWPAVRDHDIGEAYSDALLDALNAI